MNARTFKLPDGVLLNLPRDYAKNCLGDPVTILAEVWNDGLLIRWDDSVIQFVADKGGVSYRRSKIIRFHITHARTVMAWTLSELTVELDHGGSPTLYCEAPKKDRLQEVVRAIVEAAVPLDGLTSTR